MAKRTKKPATSSLFRHSVSCCSGGTNCSDLWNMPSSILPKIVISSCLKLKQIENTATCVAGFLRFGGWEGTGGGKEGKPATIPLNVAFRPHDFGGKINQSEHRRKLKFWTGFWTSSAFANKSCEQAVTPMLWASSTWSWMIVSRGHV